MANISAQSTRSSGKAQAYVKKGPVAISAIGAPVPMFEQRLLQVRRAYDKDGVRPKNVLDENGKIVRDENGQPLVAKDAKGNTIYESKYVQAYPLVQSFGHHELDSDDPASWERAQELGRAVAEDQFPGHPALIATEVSGRSGCVHNHIIIGAINSETGKSLDSNRVTHSRLAIEHDRVLVENGFRQGEDMAAITSDAKRRILEAREAREAAEAELPKGLSESQRQRRLIAAENSVKFRGQGGQSATQEREAKRLREYDRYMLNEQTREAALAIGAQPPKERFSEIVLEERIKIATSDPRVRSWEDLSAIGREHGVTITQRGQDVSYGMMLAEIDGTLAEPARAHTRRGGIQGSGKGLGAGFRRSDVETAMQQNLDLQKPAITQQMQQPTKSHGEIMAEALAGAGLSSEERALLARQQAEHSELAVETEPAFQPKRFVSKPEQVAPGVAGQPESQTPAASPAFRSRLRGVRATTGPMQARIDSLAALDEDHDNKPPSTPAERAAFELRVNAIGIGPKVLYGYGKHLNPQLREQLARRTEWIGEAKEKYDVATDTHRKYASRSDELVERSGSGAVVGDVVLDSLRATEKKAAKRNSVLMGAVRSGDYAMSHQELATGQSPAQPKVLTPAQQKAAERQEKTAKQNTRLKERAEKEQSQGQGMEF